MIYSFCGRGWEGGRPQGAVACGFMNVQSAVLCDVQVGCIHCIKIWSFLNVCSAPFEVRFFFFEKKKAKAHPMGP